MLPVQTLSTKQLVVPEHSVFAQTKSTERNKNENEKVWVIGVDHEWSQTAEDVLLKVVRSSLNFLSTLKQDWYNYLRYLPTKPEKVNS